MSTDLFRAFASLHLFGMIILMKLIQEAIYFVIIQSKTSIDICSNHRVRLRWAHPDLSVSSVNAVFSLAGSLPFFY
ncbi:hypothetical protein EMIT07CA2_70057 [Brevibacillus sp. IT-7CA2]